MKNVPDTENVASAWRFTERIKINLHFAFVTLPGLTCNSNVKILLFHISYINFDRLNDYNATHAVTIVLINLCFYGIDNTLVTLMYMFNL